MSSLQESSPSSGDTKNIKIQGDANIFGDIRVGGNPGKTKRTQRSKAKRQIQMTPRKIDDEKSGPALVPVPTPSIVQGGKTVDGGKTVEGVAGGAVPAPTAAPTATLSNHVQKMKVILKNPPQKDKKVHLKPKKTNHELKHTTRKSRKVTVGLLGLKKRLTKAHNIRKSLASKPIDELRKDLVAKGIIKAGSKTPDSLIRQIAGDTEIVKGNLL